MFVEISVFSNQKVMACENNYSGSATIPLFQTRYRAPWQSCGCDKCRGITLRCAQHFMYKKSIKDTVPSPHLFFLKSERGWVVGRDGPAVRVVITVVRGNTCRKKTKSTHY